MLTFDEPITACEISSDGKMIVIALQGRTDIFPLSLSRSGENFPTPVSEIQPYGDQEFIGKTFELSG